MTENLSEKILCSFGMDTLRGSIIGGYANLTVGLVALCESGLKPGDAFSRKQLLACGLGEDLVKTILNQCEGREYDERKGPKDRTKNKEANKRTPEEQEELNNVIQDLRRRSPEPSLNLLLIAGWDSSKIVVRRKKPPESSAVKALFSISNKPQPLDLSPIKSNCGPGCPPRWFVLPSPDEYAQLFVVVTSDADQVHYAISGLRTTKKFCDIFHRVWMETNQNDVSNKHYLNDLCNVQADSAKTLRSRNECTDIEVKPNFICHHVTEKELKGLLLSCRGGCWFELELPNRVFPLISSFNFEVRAAPKYHVDKAGHDKAKKEWEDAGSPGKFIDCLRICGYDVSSYILHGEQVFSGFASGMDTPHAFLVEQSKFLGLEN